jgi:dihydrofolate reductase
MAANRCIGRDGTLPWHIPEDLKHFRRVTEGHAILMGRRTYESIGRPLPKRHNIVLSRDPHLELPGCEVVGSLSAGIEVAVRLGDDVPRVIGGAAIYSLAMPVTTELFLTELSRTVEGDTFFPAFDRAEWDEVERRPLESEPGNFIHLKRRS